MVLAGKIMTEEVKEMDGKVVDGSYQPQPVFKKLACVRIQLSFRTRNLNMNKFATEDVHRIHTSLPQYLFVKRWS